MIPAPKKLSGVVIERILIFAKNGTQIGHWDENFDEKWRFGATRRQLCCVFVTIAIGEVIVSKRNRFRGSSIAISHFSIFPNYALFGALSSNFPQFWVAHKFFVISPNRTIPKPFFHIWGKVRGRKGYTTKRSAKYGSSGTQKYAFLGQNGHFWGEKWARAA